MEKQDVRLVFKIEHTQPLDLADFTTSLTALRSQFQSFVATHPCKESKNTKLYVKEVKQGSIIVEMVQIDPTPMLAMMGEINTIVDFTGFLVRTLKTLAGIAKEEKDEALPIPTRTSSDMSKIVTPVANDNNGARLIIYNTGNGDVNVNEC